MQIKRNLDFKFKNLLNLFEKLSTYKTSCVRDWNGENCIVVRHDIDISIKKALYFARMESCHKKINSTYFVMTTAPTYNISSKENRSCLREIFDMGFEIGLHFDPSIYENADAKYIEKIADSEANIISEIIGEHIVSISLHNVSLITRKFEFGKRFKEAYSYFGGIWGDKGIYVSDSRMEFPKNIYDIMSKSVECPIQLLLHPEHYSINGDSYDRIFSKVVLDYIEDIERAFEVNSKYKEVVRGRLKSSVRRAIYDSRSDSSA